jgi:3-dehydroquinate dehydratase type I
VLKDACRLGATYIDVEIEASEDFLKAAIAAARPSGTKVIISYHNFLETPPAVELSRIVDRCFSAGADVAKVACTVKTPADNAALLGLLVDKRPLVVVGMGELGKVTRIAAPLLGAVFTFAAPADQPGTAEGQLSADEMRAFYAALAKLGVK